MLFRSDWEEDAPPPLSNFFGSGTLPLPKIEPIERTEMGAPKPKMPRQAHYIHDEKEETQYATDVKPDPIFNQAVITK